MGTVFDMDMVERIAARLSHENPEIFSYVNNTRKIVDGQARNRLLSEWAAAALVSGFQTIRLERNMLLAASDWTQASDAPVDAKAWAKYRQALRDLPETIKDPTAEIKWPDPPK